MQQPAWGNSGSFAYNPLEMMYGYSRTHRAKSRILTQVPFNEIEWGTFALLVTKIPFGFDKQYINFLLCMGTSRWELSTLAHSHFTSWQKLTHIRVPVHNWGIFFSYSGSAQMTKYPYSSFLSCAIPGKVGCQNTADLVSYKSTHILRWEPTFLKKTYIRQVGLIRLQASCSPPTMKQ